MRNADSIRRHVRKLMAEASGANVAWAEHAAESLINFLQAIVREEVNYQMRTLPHSEPKTTDELIIEWWIGVASRDANVRVTVSKEALRAIVDYVIWQRARIKHMATDNGFQDGVEAGYKDWLHKNQSWLRNLTTAGTNNYGDSVCACCYLFPHADYCELHNALQTIERKSS